MGVMTPPVAAPSNRHDTLSGVTGKSGKGTARQTIRIDEVLWERFGRSAAAVDSDRSAILRDFIRWFNHDPDAMIPARPAESPEPGEPRSTDRDNSRPGP